VVAARAFSNLFPAQNRGIPRPAGKHLPDACSLKTGFSVTCAVVLPPGKKLPKTELSGQRNSVVGPGEIYSRSASVRVHSERRRTAGTIPPCCDNKKWIEPWSLPKTRPISCSDSPAFQWRQISVLWAEERPYRLPTLINTTSKTNDLWQTVLHPPVELAGILGKCLRFWPGAVRQRAAFDGKLRRPCLFSTLRLVTGSDLSPSCGSGST
jgi:hypothetical protein